MTRGWCIFQTLGLGDRWLGELMNWKGLQNLMQFNYDISAHEFHFYTWFIEPEVVMQRCGM